MNGVKVLDDCLVVLIFFGLCLWWLCVIYLIVVLEYDIEYDDIVLDVSIHLDKDLTIDVTAIDVDDLVVVDLTTQDVFAVLHLQDQPNEDGDVPLTQLKLLKAVSEFCFEEVVIDGGSSNDSE